jgi:uncharacterized membrane protein
MATGSLEDRVQMRTMQSDLQRQLRELEQHNRFLEADVADLCVDSLNTAQLSSDLSAAEHEIGGLSAAIRARDATITPMEV